MLDHFIAIDKKFFLDIGGFSPQAGRYAFMDICLKSSEFCNDDKTAIYLPQVNLISYGTPGKLSMTDSIYFFSRWHSALWDSEDILYEKDGVSRLQLESARMTRAMETAGI